MAVTLREARIAQRNELRAEKRFNDVRKVANSLFIRQDSRFRPRSSRIHACAKADRWQQLQYLDSLSSEAAGDTSLQRELATAYERVGEVQGDFTFF